MRWHCREGDRAKGFFLTLQQLLHLLLCPGDPTLTGLPGLPTEWDHCLPAPLRGRVGCQELKQAGGGKRNGPSAIWEKGWDWMGHLPKELGWTGETGVHFCMGAPAWSPRQGLGLPHTSSSLAGLCLPLISNFVIATWGLAGGILPWQGTGWWQPSPGHHHCMQGLAQGGRLKGKRVLGRG